MFNPLRDIPSNDEEVKIALAYQRSELTGAILFNIYRTHRALGKTLLKAYEATLETHIKVSEASRDTIS